MQPDPDETTLLLARAFDRAWARYYRPGRVTIAPEIARPALAAHLVEMAKAGTVEESALAAGGASDDGVSAPPSPLPAPVLWSAIRVGWYERSSLGRVAACGLAGHKM